jgi:hypothetical protein
MVQHDVGVGVEQAWRDLLAEAQRVARALRVTGAHHRDEHGAGQPRHLQWGGEVGERTVARAEQRGRVAAPRVTVGEPSGYGGEVDLAEPIWRDALGDAEVV